MRFTKIAASIAFLVASHTSIAGTPVAGDFPLSDVEYQRTVISENSRVVANGIIWGRVGENKGKLISASAFNSAIRVIDPDTGRLVRSYGFDDGVIFPDDLVEGPDGSLYFTNLIGGKISNRNTSDRHAPKNPSQFIRSISTFSASSRGLGACNLKRQNHSI